MEFTTTYNPFRKWRISANINLFKQKVRGDYSYENFEEEVITQNFDADNFSWFTRMSAKIPLPANIDFQTNVFYRGPFEDAQNKRKGILSTNLAFSKTIFNDKGNIALNVSDLFNTRKRRIETLTNSVFTNTEFQWRERQITLSFTYRFNQQKDDRRRERNRNNNGGDFEFEG